MNTETQQPIDEAIWQVLHAYPEATTKSTVDSAEIVMPSGLVLGRGASQEQAWFDARMRATNPKARNLTRPNPTLQFRRSHCSAVQWFKEGDSEHVVRAFRDGHGGIHEEYWGGTGCVPVYAVLGIGVTVSPGTWIVTFKEGGPPQVWSNKIFQREFFPIEESKTSPADVQPHVLESAEWKPLIYVASRASIPEYPHRWRRFRDAGEPIISSWIDEAGPGETVDAAQLWTRITDEIRQCTSLILDVAERHLPIKGAYVEVGMALALGKPVYVMLTTGPSAPRPFSPLGSWLAHPLVTMVDSLDRAFRLAKQPPGKE